MKENKKDTRRQWPTGVLTQEVIKKDTRSGLLTGALIFTVAAVLFCIVAAAGLWNAVTISLKDAAFLIGAAFCAVAAYQKWAAFLNRQEYRIEEDRIVSKRIDADINKKDARQSDLSTRIPILELEKHGTYQIDAEQIHPYYIPLQLIHDFQEQEALYLVYDKKTGKLLRIYRKKYWTLPEEKDM